VSRTPIEEQISEQLHRMAEYADTTPHRPLVVPADQVTTSRHRSGRLKAAASGVLLVALVGIVTLVVLKDSGNRSSTQVDVSGADTARIYIEQWPEVPVSGGSYVERGQGQVDLKQELLVERLYRTRSEGRNLDYEIRIVNDCEYTNDPEFIKALGGGVPADRPWFRSCTDGTFSPIRFLPQRFDNALAQLGGDSPSVAAARLGSESVRGSLATRYRFQFPDETPGYSEVERRGKKVVVDYWIDESDRFVRIDRTSELTNIHRRYEFYDFGTPISVSVPDASQLFDDSDIVPPVAPSVRSTEG
jgi:hypothetical protein